ncbi:MAG: flagellar hook-basal body complex protein FliE [Vicinamibacterales bacterium]
MAIDPISAGALSGALTGTTTPGAAGAAPGAGASFTSSLESLIESVNSTTSDANNAVNNMVTGTGDVHSAMIALQRAETMLEFTVQVRNKLVQAYQDVMRMPM